MLRDEDPFGHFVRAQDAVYSEVLDELAAGRKTGHWMWFVFPQVAGLDLRDVMYDNGPYARLARDSFHYGVASYERQLVCIASDPQGSMARYINTLMALGDWHMLFGKPGAGYTKYREARDLLATLNITGQSVDRVLRPQVPVSIPTFTATANSVDLVDQKGGMLAPYSGYIDVTFHIQPQRRCA